MDYLFALALIAAGLLGASGLILAKRPNAANLINAIMPFQALIGAGTLVLAILTLLRIGPKIILEITKSHPILGASLIGGIVCGILLGLVFAVPLMGRLGAGQQRAAELAENIAPWQLLIGLVSIVAGLLLFLIRSGLLPEKFLSNQLGF
jgi:hypothetical protein